MRMSTNTLHTASDLQARWRLAGEWENLLALAGSRPRNGRLRVTPMTARILEAQPAIERLTDVLYSPEPVDARGMAIARALVRDGTGPVYNPYSAHSLVDAIDQAVAALEPGPGLGSPDAHARG
jgi:hypothetical protein